ncbi:MAG TPA: response regulator, partial [Thermoanaerobaculia bacterium]|nr:response regulator [Thermoanaerobaculia bacterium]
MRFLLVEDNEILIEGLTMVLREEGHEVIVSREGRPALGLIAHHRPDAVILDISLPDIDGVQVAKFIRAAHPALPIVFASG